jgi:hypothetical protein
MPLDDRIVERSREDKLARLRAELPKAGLLGRLALRLLEHAESRR